MRWIKQQGVTLLEMLLVLAIASAIILMIVGYTTQKMGEFRRDKVSLQMQQILNAGLAYYTNTSTWPNNLSTLQAAGYLPTPLNNPWGKGFTVDSTSSGGKTLSVSTDVTVAAAVDAKIIAGRLPLGTADVDATKAIVKATVNIPGQNLNNARSMNFGSLYHSGACVPVPTCPGSMEAQIYVVPASVSGVVRDPNCTTVASCQPVANPITHYTAYATKPNYLSDSSPKGPPSCNSPDNTATGVECWQTINGQQPVILPNDGRKYWRVCLAVDTDQGPVKPTGPPGKNPVWGQIMGTVLTITKCVPPNEPSGSGFVVFDNQ